MVYKLTLSHILSASNIKQETVLFLSPHSNTSHAQTAFLRCVNATGISQGLCRFYSHITFCVSVNCRRGHLFLFLKKKKIQILQISGATPLLHATAGKCQLRLYCSSMGKKKPIVSRVKLLVLHRKRHFQSYLSSDQFETPQRGMKSCRLLLQFVLTNTFSILLQRKPFV